MKKILVAGAGGAPSEGVIKSLKKSKKRENIIGMGSEPLDLVLSCADRKYVVPYADQPDYKDKLLKILSTEKPDLVHFQNDLEIYHASLIREEIINSGTALFMPEHDVIDTCVHKYQTYEALKTAGLVVPENILLHNESDLKLAFKTLKNSQGKIWLRSCDIGGGGKGSLPTADFDLAKSWINHYDGWGSFTAANMLTDDTITWLSIWYHGELIVAQTRVRKGWAHGNRAVSGVTGVTKVGVTTSNEVATKVATDSVFAVSDRPHGIFGVDMTFDVNGHPNPTEINISRFFTTVLFFTEAGLNLPEIFKDLILYDEKPLLEKKINPLSDGLMWLRGMDTEPLLMKDTNLECKFNYT